MTRFTAAELEEMRLADGEIDWVFRLTQDELDASRRRDWEAHFDALPLEKQRVAAYQKAYYEANREKVAAYQKSYYEANREKVAAYKKAYYEANREKVAAYQKAYYEANREKVAAYQKSYYEANREKVAAYKKAYYEANREKVAAAQSWIHAARVERGYTQCELAQLCGVSQPTIAMLEIGMIPLEKSKCAERLREILTGFREREEM